MTNKTTDYSKFKYIDSNRVLIPATVERLKKSIAKIGYNISKPVLVNEKFEIIDGQHRVEACKELKIPVLYCIQKSNGVSNEDLIIELNRNQSIWRLSEYLHHWAKRGVKSHQEILLFMMNHNISNVSLAINLCCKSNHSMSSYIREGKRIELNPKRVECVKFLKSCIKLPFYQSLNFSRAVKVAFDKATARQMAKLLSKHLSIPQQPSTETYLRVFENIINKNAKSDQKIALSL